ncbi:unconventional prefoldin RPB5 interactor 1 [Pieris napi]|uniref:unconventional prefoldin RPB5 interactor 1 n=1 Tax=Pieris napi TaxID=78633 RepID=UPI001FB8B573|nr:unconventional prefoldin RPB5 interactor 1 [Pieris napi]
MNFLHNVYKKSLEENERNINFWEAYVDDLNSLDFSIFSDKLTVPVLVPIGNKIFFRGLLKHTNEVTVSLGADYFAKCSIKQAEIIKQHRIKDAQSKLDLYRKETGYLENQLKLNKCTNDTLGQDIIETCTEEEDRIWKEKHKEKVKQYNQSKEKHLDKCDNEMTDNELWSRLEELELQEELEEEYLSMTNGKNYEEADNSLIIKDDIPTKQNPVSMSKQLTEVVGVPDHSNNSESKVPILEQLMIRQKNLELKLTELQNKKGGNSETEDDLLEKLNEIDQLDELEDEMNRLDDILNEESEESEKTTEEISTLSSKKTVTFANDDDSKTLEISLKHSDVEPDTAPYNPTSGIKKPSDIYEAISTKLLNQTTSILKKTKYVNNDLKHSDENKCNIESPEIGTQRETIVVKDVLEKVDENNKLHNQLRPVSLFKKRRQIQMK